MFFFNAAAAFQGGEGRRGGGGARGVPCEFKEDDDWGGHVIIFIESAAVICPL